MTRSTTPKIHRLEAETPGDLARSLAQAITTRLSQRLAEHPRASLFVSGGSTPGPLFDALVESAALPWERVDLGLVDDRWVAHDDPDSNTRLVRERLMRGPVARARLHPLVSEVAYEAGPAAASAMLEALGPPRSWSWAWAATATSPRCSRACPASPRPSTSTPRRGSSPVWRPRTRVGA
ncbi:6-phosphogluconolactonase [Plesiocystis pacifica SIR-1]|uniref:6-phosphogluconolactonase n=1 Tax=Plesiocystis pacifica SIR-1 TaxID=391625 RepID=A6GCS6_9BACT|nr:6-phosphogluconolactonase [Plesiocystis pacifica]EDM76342.1 6-phosphogluconolactonase [Plesiocystis pacifica SIR-1]